MAEVNKTGYLSFNAVDYSAYTRGITHTIDVPELDATVWGSEAQVAEPGLPKNSVVARMIFDPDNNHAQLVAAAWAGTQGAIAFRFDSTTIGATNPELRSTAAWVANVGTPIEVNGVKMIDVTFSSAAKYTYHTS